jgi:hypothetical protein
MNPTASALQAAHWSVHPVVIAVLEAIASGLASDYKKSSSIGMEDASQLAAGFFTFLKSNV